MTKSEIIEAVRDLVKSGEIEPVNVYARLEHILSGAEIDALLREWERCCVLARGA